MDNFTWYNPTKIDGWFVCFFKRMENPFCLSGIPLHFMEQSGILFKCKNIRNFNGRSDSQI